MRHGKLFILFFTIVLFSGCKKDTDVYNPPLAPKAIAGNSQTIQLPQDSVILNGLGSSVGSKIIGYLWSEVSGPNVPVIASQSSASTVVRGLKSGTYIFQFEVIDTSGLTGVDTVSVIVLPSPIITLNLQPSNSSGDFTIWGNVSGLDQSDSMSTELGAASWTYNGIRTDMRGIVKFDLSNIPQNATILSAKLSVYSIPTPLNGDHVHANYGTDNTLLIQQITTMWYPSQVNWVHQPSTTTTGQIEIPSTTSPYLDLVDIDVTNLLSGMVNNNANYGFLLRIKNEVIYNCRIFCSSKFSDATKHPKLIVTYKIN